MNGYDLFCKSFCLCIKSSQWIVVVIKYAYHTFDACMNELLLFFIYKQVIFAFIIYRWIVCYSLANFASHFRFCVRFSVLLLTPCPYRNFIILIFISLSIFQCNTHTHMRHSNALLYIYPSLILFPSSSLCGCISAPVCCMCA